MDELKVIRESEYVGHFQQYLGGFVKKFVHLDLSEHPGVETVFDRLTEHVPENPRSRYVLYLLWAYSDEYYGFYRVNAPEYIEKSLKIFLIMKTDFIRFHDDNMHRLIDILQARAADFDQSEIPFVPIEPVFEEIMKFLHTCVIQFKRKMNLPILYDPDHPNFY